MSDQLGEHHGVILCDMCADKDRKPAQKTCMKCEISMCAEHLKPHLTTPVLLQTHLLTEPVALGSAMKCPQHGKLLEYYCLDDLTCVCVSCAIEDQHRLHNMKTFSTAHKELKEKLAAEQQELQTRTRAVGLEEWERAETAKVKHSSIQLVQAVNNLRDLALSRVQNSVSARMVSIKTSKERLQAAQHETDTFRFLRMYSEVLHDVEKAKAVDLRPGLEPEAERLTLVQELSQNNAKMVAQAKHFWKALLVLVDPESKGEIFPKDPNLTFDPKMSETCMPLSRDKRKIFYIEFQAPRYQTSLFHIQNSDPKSLRPQLKRWALRLSSDFDWTIGLCQEEHRGSNNDGIFGLCYKSKQLSSLPGGKHHDISRPDHVTNMQTYEVMWHHSASLSFFSLTEQHQRREIITLKLDPSLKNLTPFVRLEVEEMQAAQYSSSIMSNQIKLRQKKGHPAYQTTWNCSCGQVHYLDANYLQSRQQYNCNCGNLIGGLCTIDLLCELL